MAKEYTFSGLPPVPPEGGLLRWPLGTLGGAQEKPPGASGARLGFESYAANPSQMQVVSPPSFAGLLLR